MKRVNVDALAGEALRLRGWALQVLTAAENRPIPAPPPASTRGWELFLRAERCALPLSRSLRGREGQDALPADAARVLGALALDETRRVLAARAQLRQLSRWAAERGETAVVLKGAVAAVDDRHAVDLSDIDVWMAPGAEDDLLEHLARTGHMARTDGLPMHHHEARLTEQLVAIEVHREIPDADLDAGWSDRVRPLHAALPGMACLDAADHLWHVLVHATIQHLERYGQLRDLMLLAYARSMCSSAERRSVVERARRTRSAGPLLAMLDMAEHIACKHEPFDAFALVAAGRYLQALAAHRYATADRAQVQATAALLRGPRACASYLAFPIRRWKTPSPRPALTMLQRRNPRLGRAVVFSLRLTRRAMAIVTALRTARAARRIARDYGPHTRGMPA
ncbi:MAG TPA: nucleotidyltransferase family protein [Longimicrobiales bacterium]